MKLKPGHSVRYRDELWTFNGYTTRRIAVISAKGRRSKWVGADKIVRAYKAKVK